MMLSFWLPWTMVGARVSAYTARKSAGSRAESPPTSPRSFSQARASPRSSRLESGPSSPVNLSRSPRLAGRTRYSRGSFSSRRRTSPRTYIAWWSPGTAACSWVPRMVKRARSWPFSPIMKEAKRRSPMSYTSPPPSVSEAQQSTSSGRFLTSQPMPAAPPTSSSAVARKRTGRPPPPVLASSASVTAWAATTPLQSMAPRPQTQPSAISPPKGSRFHFETSPAGTTSRCPMIRSGFLPSSPGRSAETFPRPGRLSTASAETPRSVSQPARYRAHSSSFPGGLVVSNRMRADNSSAASSRSGESSIFPSLEAGNVNIIIAIANPVF